MNTLRHSKTLLATLLVALASGCTAEQAQDPLPSWNDGAAKTAILEFVAAVTEEVGRDYVEPAERAAVSFPAMFGLALHAKGMTYCGRTVSELSSTIVNQRQNSLRVNLI